MRLRIAIRVVVVGSLLCSACSDRSGPQTAQQGEPEQSKLDALSYNDKSAPEWIAQLGGPDDENSRAEAAEALGFIARTGKWTLGGFSDVPYDAPKPAELSEEALRPIVAALAAGLKDSENRVRASSAIAVSWIGPRAEACVPRLIALLDDPDDRTRKSALTALGQIGPAAKSAIPRLEPMLAKEEGYMRTCVAQSLRLTGAPPDSFVPAMIGLLAADGRGNASHYAAMELSHLGDPAVAALLQALRDTNSTTRRNAAYAISSMAGWEKLTKDRESVARALIELARDNDPNVVYRAAQAIGSVRASPETAIPALVALLEHPDTSVAEAAAESLGEFGSEARPAIPALIRSLRADGGRGSFNAAYAIREIGIDQTAADALRNLKAGAIGSWFLIPLCKYPEIAAEFLERNPEAIDVPARDLEELTRLMRDSDARLKRVQELLSQNEDLPLPVIAELGQARFLPLIEKKIGAANAHERTKLEACARACGAPAERIVAISASQPGDFKPKSAWPDVDPARRAPDAHGHGDGLTTVIVTGRILKEDGTPAVSPRFFEVNDNMLLGQRMREEVPVTFDAKAGRFVFVTDVFAAYSGGEGQPEPGPYQTGSSMVLIESEGCHPLEVRFYDEMPEVRITLSTARR